MRNRNRRAWRHGWIAIGTAVGLACGDGDGSTMAGAPMEAETSRSETAPRAVNTPPQIHDVTLQPASPKPGQQVKARVGVTDPDGDALELIYDWRVDGKRTGKAGETYHVEGVGRGSRIEVVVVASDGRDASAAARAAVYVGNLAPILHGLMLEPPTQVTTGRDLAVSPRAADPDGDDLSYEYRWLVNDEEVRERGPVLSAAHFARGDRIRVVAVASDGQEESEPLRSDPISVVNAEPRITSTPGGLDNAGVFRYRIEVEDPDDEPSFRYRLLAGPLGMDLDVVDGTLNWRPDEDQEGRHDVKIEVGDRNGGRATQSFVIALDLQDETAPAAPAE